MVCIHVHKAGYNFQRKLKLSAMLILLLTFLFDFLIMLFETYIPEGNILHCKCLSFGFELHRDFFRPNNSIRGLPSALAKQLSQRGCVKSKY